MHLGPSPHVIRPRDVDAAPAVEIVLSRNRTQARRGLLAARVFWLADRDHVHRASLCWPRHRGGNPQVRHRPDRMTMPGARPPSLDADRVERAIRGDTRRSDLWRRTLLAPDHDH
jgi:hypothetical protein